MIFTAPALLGTMLLAGYQQPGQAPEGTPAILARSFHARVRFEGIRTMTSQEGEAFRQRVLSDGTNLRIEFLSGKRQGDVVIETHGVRYVLNSARKEVEIHPMHVGATTARATGERPNVPKFTFVQGDGERIAGIPTEMWTINRADGITFLKVWVDPVTAMTVKRESFGKEGKMMNSMTYTSLNLRPRISDNAFRYDIPGYTKISVEDKARRTAFTNGFEPVFLRTPNLTLEGSRLLNEHGTKAFMQTYAGPRARVSLFQINGEFNSGDFGGNQRQKLHMVSWKRGARTFVLVSNLPENVLRELARGLGGD